MRVGPIYSRVRDKRRRTFRGDREKHSPTLDTLGGFDEAMSQLLWDWNAPGFGVSVIVNGVPVLTHGYGYRDSEKKLPFDASTLFPIASSTRLFAAKLTYDRPLRDKAPTPRL